MKELLYTDAVFGTVSVVAIICNPASGRQLRCESAGFGTVVPEFLVGSMIGCGGLGPAEDTSCHEAGHPNPGVRGRRLSVTDGRHDSVEATVLR